MQIAISRIRIYSTIQIRIHVEFFFSLETNPLKRFSWIISSKWAFPFLSWIKKLQRSARLDSLPLRFMRLIMFLTEHCLWLRVQNSRGPIGHILEAQYLGIVGESIRPVILIHCYPRCGERKILYRSSTGNKLFPVESSSRQFYYKDP